MRKVKNTGDYDSVEVMIKQLREGPSESSDNFIVPKVINSIISMFPYQGMNTSSYSTISGSPSSSFNSNTKDEISPSILFNSYMT